MLLSVIWTLWKHNFPSFSWLLQKKKSIQALSLMAKQSLRGWSCSQMVWLQLPSGLRLCVCCVDVRISVCECGCAHAAAQKMLIEKRAICFEAAASVPRQKGRGGNEAIVFTPKSSNTSTGRAHRIFFTLFLRRERVRNDSRRGSFH